MRNLSILFSVLSFTVFLFGMCLWMITNDNNIVKFTGLVTVLLLLSSSFINGLAIQSEEDRIIKEKTADETYDSLYRRLDEVEQDTFDRIADCNRDFDHRINSIWSDVEHLRKDSTKRK